MIKIEFKGYVNEVLPYNWGTVYRMSHNQVIKNHQGEWEQTGRDYFSVSVSNDSQTIRATFAKDDFVEVVGRLKTKLYDKRDGSGKGVSLEVRADEMRKVERGKPSASVADMQNVWPALKQVPDDSVPF